MPPLVSPGPEAQANGMDGARITASSLGGAEFKKEYNLTYAYLAGGMYRGIASREMVIRMGKAGMLGFFGTGGMDAAEIEDAIRAIQSAIPDKPYGMNFLHNHETPDAEEALVDLFLQYDVRNIEAAAFMRMTPALVRYRLSGLRPGSNGNVEASHGVIGKLSRPEVAREFLSPAPGKIVDALLKQGKITGEQAALSQKTPMADAICVEADSGGHTDGGVAYALTPAIIHLRDRMTDRHGYSKQVHIGAAGGIGAPGAAAAAFIQGADFILTGSINQCTVEAGTSDAVKDLLQQINIQDTDYAPAGDMFEIGARVQVLRKGVFFPSRANKLYELYQRYDSLEEIDENTIKQLERTYFKKSMDQVYEETKAFFAERDPRQIEKAERNPKHKMALIFRWYFGYSNRAAMEGDMKEKVNFQVHTGPALGAFNQWTRGTDLENWRNRRVDRIGIKLMEETAALLNRRFSEMVVA